MVVSPCAIYNALIIGLGGVNDVGSGLATEDLEWQMLGIPGCTGSISRWHSVRL
jgi:hypothetical protein